MAVASATGPAGTPPVLAFRGVSGGFSWASGAPVPSWPREDAGGPTEGSGSGEVMTSSGVCVLVSDIALVTSCDNWVEL